MGESEIANLFVLGGLRQMSVDGGAAIVNLSDMVMVFRTREVDAMASGRCKGSYRQFIPSGLERAQVNS